MAPDGFAFDFSGDGGARTLWAGPGLASADDVDARARWAAFDLAHGLPRLAQSQGEKWTPQQLSLERLHAYSVKQGCSPDRKRVLSGHSVAVLVVPCGRRHIKNKTIPALSSTIVTNKH